jgi:hypothetical protein
MIIPYLLMFLAGLGIGYAAQSNWMWAVLSLPVILLLLAWASSGIDGEVIVRFLIGVGITAVGVIVGDRIDRNQAASATP